MSTADKLNKILETKSDIKQALIDKGQNPTDVFSSYADDIRAIETSSGSDGVFDFAAIGYTGDEEPLKSGIEYAKVLIDKIKNWTGLASPVQDDLNLIIYPKVQGDNFVNAHFDGCKNLILVPEIIINVEEGFYLSLSDFFGDCSSLQNISIKNTSRVINMDRMFLRCSKLKDIGYLNCENVTSANNIFDGCESLNYNPLYNTNNITKMEYMFNNCVSLHNPDFSELNTSNVTSMRYMFSGCFNLTNIDLSNFNTSNVINMEYMFQLSNPTKATLTQLDLSSFDTSNVTNMSYMFSGQGNLKTIILPEKFGQKASNITYMFQKCYNLEYIPAFSTDNCNNMSYLVDGCSNLKRIEGISIKSLTKISHSDVLGFSDLPTLRYFLCKDIGFQQSVTSVIFTYNKLSNWGVVNDEVPDARQSLIDSLITYSFDRATAEYSTCTINLSTNTKALLTEDEIAQITAKGFTIA